MKFQDLGFCQAIKLDDDLAEFVVNEGVELDLPMVGTYHDWIVNNMSIPCLVLVNKVNSYTYTFDAQIKIGTLPEIKAIAFIVYSRVSKIATEALSDLPRDRVWNFRIFNNRENAIDWLKSQR